MAKKNKGGYYAVASGRKPGIYSTWDEAKAQVEGFSGAKHQKFQTQQQAQDYVSSYSFLNIPASTTQKPSQPTKDGVRFNPYPKRMEQKVSRAAPGTRKVYCDGACRNNGKSNAVAGIGVHWNNSQFDQDLAEKLPGEIQTNQKAELYAILRVLESDASPNKDLEILTDSQYAINCLRFWHQSWAQNKWKTSTGKPVLHSSLIQLILYQINHRPSRKITLTHVKGHSGDQGNEKADALAVQGATLPALPDRNFDQELEELKLKDRDWQDIVQAELNAVMDPDLWLSDEELMDMQSGF